MAVIAGYTTLLSTVADYIARSDLTSFVPNFVQNMEERFYRQPRNFGRWMESTFSVTIANSVAAVPSDYLGLKVAYVDGQTQPPLDRVSLQSLYGAYPRNGDSYIPRRIARDGANFVFGPLPDTNYTITGTYIAKPVLLRNFASDAAAHYLIVNAPDLLLYGALVEAQPFIMNDKRMPLWQGMYNSALDDYRSLFKEEDRSGSPIVEVLA